ncbi:MAG TPA: hypothetical protein VHG51_07615 [Longimicrobiaceae bacterium]|nr:hypothetical protein [Longimicrobiaceae bacterium]
MSRPIVLPALLCAAALLAACAPPAADARDGTAPPAAWSAVDALPSSGAFSMNDHQVADLRAGPDGSLHALFLDDGDGDGRTDRLLYASSEGGAWSAPAPVEEGRISISSPRLVAEGDRVHVFWMEGRDPADPSLLTGVLHRVRAAGEWSEAEPVYRAADGQGLAGALAAVADAAGRVHLVHPVWNGFVHRVLAGGGWQPPLPAGREGMQPRLVAGPDGGLALAVLGTFPHPLLPRGSGAHNDPSVRFYRGEGWTEPTPVHPDPAQHSHAPQLAWDAEGVLHAVWMEGERGEMMPTRLLHATSADGTRWSAPEEIAPDATGRIFYSPRLAVDGRGTLHLTFARFRDGLSDPRHFHARYDGARWSLPARILPDEGTRDSELETAVDPAGRLHALWKAADGTYRHSVLQAPPGVR